MACSDKFAVSFAVAKPGDEIRVWIDKCDAGYYITGDRTVISGPAKKKRTTVTESHLNPASPLTHVYQKDESVTVTLFFDPSTSKGKSCEVHGEVVSPTGTVRKEWCHKVSSGTSDPDFASFSVKAG